MHFTQTSNVETSDVYLASREEAHQRVLYVRLMMPQTPSSFTVLSNAAQKVQAEIQRAKHSHRAYQQVVVVGADRLFEHATAKGAEEGIDVLADLLKNLCENQMHTTWRTRAGLKAGLPSQLGAAFAAGGEYLRIEMGLPSIELHLCKTLEGANATPPEQRLRLAGAAAAHGVMTVALLDPLVPMLTDQAADLSSLFNAFARAGLHKVKVRYLVMTRDRAKRLAQSLSPMHRALIRGVFAEEPWRNANPSGCGPQEAHKLLPAKLRVHGHERVALEAQRAGLLLEILDPIEQDAPLVQRGIRTVRSIPQLDFFSKSA